MQTSFCCLRFWGHFLWVWSPGGQRCSFSTSGASPGLSRFCWRLACPPVTPLVASLSSLAALKWSLFFCFSSLAKEGECWIYPEVCRVFWICGTVSFVSAVIYQPCPFRWCPSPLPLSPRRHIHVFSPCPICPLPLSCTFFHPGFPPTVLQSGSFLLLCLILSNLPLNLSPELFISIIAFSLREFLKCSGF